GEETKMMLESRKIMGLPQLLVSATCVRVPVVRAHSVAINASFERPVSVEEPSRQAYPMPLEFSLTEKCGVGRIRLDTALHNGLAFWVSGDNLWKGAALNAVQVAELMVRDGLLRPRGALAAV